MILLSFQTLFDLEESKIWSCCSNYGWTAPDSPFSTKNALRTQLIVVRDKFTKKLKRDDCHLGFKTAFSSVEAK